MNILLALLSGMACGWLVFEICTYSRNKKKRWKNKPVRYLNFRLKSKLKSISDIKRSKN